MHAEVNIDELVGKTIKAITGLQKHSDGVKITTQCGQEYLFYHEQDCCEEVRLEDFDGDITDLQGALIVSAEIVDNAAEYIGGDESHTWTFYKIETNKGGLWMRWLGESNGYYSESVDFKQLN